MCFNASDEPLFDLYAYIARYKSFNNYFIYFIPNLLSYSFVVEKWMQQIEELEKKGDKVALAYVYAVIARKLFFFDITLVTLPEDEEVPTNFANY